MSSIDYCMCRLASAFASRISGYKAVRHYPRSPNSRPTLLIVDTALAQVPANLLLIGDEFVGRTTPVGAAPSLAWLKSATSQPRGATGRRIAWISTSGDKSSFTALSMLPMLLAPTLERHGFEVKTESEIPKELRGAEIAIVVACFFRLITRRSSVQI